MNRPIKIILFSILLLSFLICCSRNKSPLSSNSEKIDPNYPTTLFPLTSERLQQLQKEFDVLNDFKICSKLNKYGFTGERDNSKFHPNPRIKLTVNEALQIAISSLIKNKKFTNVTDSLDLLSNIRHIQTLETDSTDWKIVFGPQKYNGYEVQFSWIYVYLYGDGVYRLSGFWYSDLYIPSDDNFDINYAKEKIIGESITWYGIDGNPNEFIIDQKSILEPIVKAIFPLDKEDSIELKVVWKIPINFGDFIGWHIYFDTTIGEIVQIIQEFRT